jgi:hypothetical protein
VEKGIDMKTVWITALTKDQERVQGLAKQLQTYGLAASGHFWEDNLKERAWLGPREQIKQHDLWLLLSTGDDLATESVRLGLSLTALDVQRDKGHGHPLVLVHEGPAPAVEALPTPLRGAELLAAGDPTLGAKITALVHKPAKKVDPGYRLAIHALPHGLCFEVGSTGEAWQGGLFGVQDSEPSAAIGSQAVGPRGTLPERSTLEYPVKDIKLELREAPFSAWALRNTIDPESSYFVLVQGDPRAIVFGPFPDADQADPELFVVQLV